MEFSAPHNNSFVLSTSTESIPETSVEVVLSPEPAKPKRKRKADPSAWLKNSANAKRLKGLPHVSASGTNNKARAVQYKDCSKCPRKCDDLLKYCDREEIHQGFWDMGDKTRQDQYISDHVEEMEKNRQTTNDAESRRANSREFFFTFKGSRKQVCKGFFLSTLDVSDGRLRNVLKRRSNNNVASEHKGQGKAPANKLSDLSRDIIRSHIASFAKVPSHYCRKDTSFGYLPSDLNLPKMYEAYIEYCGANNFEPEKLWVYRDLFKSEFKLKFHIPRKDLCDVCFTYNHADDDRKLDLKSDYEMHLERKRDAATFHKKVKDQAVNGELTFVEFDLEAVRYCPSVEAKSIFYKRRLSVYNLTTYNVSDKTAKCYMWHEGIAKRGSIEVGSSLLDYLKIHSNGKPFALMSDTCGGQNRNAFVAAMLLYCVKNFNIPCIDHCFYEPGHSFMECDSVHAAIERFGKKKEIFVPSQWYSTVRSASKHSQYEVKEMAQSDFWHLKDLGAIIKNVKKDTDGNPFKWLKITWLRYSKDDDQHIFFKYKKTDPFRKFKIVRNTRAKKVDSNIPDELSRAYFKPIELSNEKVVDIMGLCRNGIIPEYYHSFYNKICEKAGPKSAQ